MQVRFQRMMGEQAGFTLIELLAVAVILIILSLMALPVYADVTDKSRTAKSAEELRVIEQALEAYKASRGQYPGRLYDLVEKGFMKPATFETPWSTDKNPIYYLYVVDKAGNDVATRFVLGDPGPGVNCSGSPLSALCGKHPKNEGAWVLSDPGSVLDGLPQLLRRASH